MGAAKVEQINYENLIPQAPAEDVVAYAYRKGAFRHSYLIYKADRAYVPLEDRWELVVSVTCSECEREFHAMKVNTGGCGSCSPAPFGWWNELTSEAVIHGSKTTCPYCGKGAETIHTSRMTAHNGELVDDVWVSILSRLPIEGRRDRLVLTDWLVRRCVNKQGHTRHEVWPYTAWVVEEKKVVRLMGYMRTMSGSISLFGKWTQRKTFADCYGSINLLMPWDRSLLEGTTAENSKLDLYLEAGGTMPVSYLALWCRRPAVENLLVQGCGRLVARWIEDEANAYGHRSGIPKLLSVNWKEKRPAQMLGLNAEEFQQLQRMGWNSSDLKVYKLVRDAGVTVRLPEDMELLRTAGVRRCELVLEASSKTDFWRILRYLKKQGQPWDILRDYWTMAGRLDWDLTDSLVRWPRDLLRAHDRVTVEQEYQEEENLRKLFTQRAMDLGKFSFASDGLLIRPCRDQAELNAEGKALHHCVGTYAKSHAGGQTAVFFIRRAEAPDEPYYTLELDEKTLTVRQNRGKYNCARTPEVEAFEAEWLAWARDKFKQPKRKGAAA